MWACFCLDSLAASGISEYHMVELGAMEIQLPSTEHDYERGYSTSNTPSLSLPLLSSPSLYEISGTEDLVRPLIILMALRNRILR